MKQDINEIITSRMSTAFDFNKNDVALYLIISATPRTGSTYVADILRQSKILGSPMEYLNPDYYMNSPEATIGKSISLNDYLQSVVQRRTSPNGIFSIHIHHHQILHARAKYRFNFFSWIKNHKTVWVHINRKNKVEQAVSLYRAISTGKWSSRVKPKKINNAVETDLAMQEIHQHYKNLHYENERWENYFSLNDIKPLYLNYEEFSKAQQLEIIEKVCMHIKNNSNQNIAFQLPKHPIKSLIKKQRVDNDLLYEEYKKRYNIC